MACGHCREHLRVPFGSQAVKCPKCGGVSGLQAANRAGTARS